MRTIVVEMNKGQLYLNCDKVLYFVPSKKGTTLFMEDGSIFELSISPEVFAGMVNDPGVIHSTNVEK